MLPSGTEPKIVWLESNVLVRGRSRCPWSHHKTTAETSREVDGRKILQPEIRLEYFEHSGHSYRRRKGQSVALILAISLVHHPSKPWHDLNSDGKKKTGRNTTQGAVEWYPLYIGLAGWKTKLAAVEFEVKRVEINTMSYAPTILLIQYFHIFCRWPKISGKW